MTEARRPRSFAAAASASASAALGLVIIPLVLWVLAPGLPARLEAVDGFLWAGETTGGPLLLREQFDGSQIVAGSDRYGIPRDEPVRCYDDPVAPLREAANARGRIEDLTLTTGMFHRLSVSSDDLGGDETSYLYRCGPHGAQPILSWGSLPGFGARARDRVACVGRGVGRRARRGAPGSRAT